jgi:hypothetical protein
MSTEQGHNGAQPRADDRPPGVERRLERDTKELIAAIERLSDDVGSSLRSQVDHRPYAALGFGFLAGYVLGGGLTFRLGTVVLAAAWRAAVGNLVARGTSIRGKAVGR